MYYNFPQNACLIITINVINDIKKNVRRNILRIYLLSLSNEIYQYSLTEYRGEYLDVFVIIYIHSVINKLNITLM